MAAETLSDRLPTPEETSRASEAVSAMAKALANDNGMPLKICQGGEEVTIEIPPAVAKLLMDVLAHVAGGEMVTVVPYGAELSTQKAADLLNVSRPFLTKLLESGRIPFHRVGSHRRMRVEDLLAYKRIRHHERATALKELQRLGQEYDAG